MYLIEYWWVTSRGEKMGLTTMILVEWNVQTCVLGSGVGENGY
jgi:hypothetical protein